MSEIVTTSRRYRRRDLPSLAAVAAPAGISEARSAPTMAADPVIDLIRQEDELRTAGVKLADKAFVLYCDATEAQRHDPAFRREVEAIGALGKALVDQAGELCDRIDTMVPGTIAGTVALLEYSGAAEAGYEAVENAIAGLRAIAAKGGAA